MTPNGTAEDESALERLFYRGDRVRFIDWRQFSGAKPTVLLVVVIAALSFISGLSNLSQETLILEGPLVGVLPGDGSYVRFAGVFFAFLLTGIVVGLRRRKRFAWYLTMAILPAMTVVPLTTLQTTDIPLLLLLFVTIPLLVWNRTQFDQPIELSGVQTATLSAIAGVGAYGTIGSYALRDQFVELDTWGDAMYYVIVTTATVGYGDITPVTPEAKWFSLSIIVFGTGAFTAALGAFIVPAIESRMATAFGNMTASELTLLEDHVLVLGHGDLTESLLEELDEVDVVVVTPDSEAAAALKDDGVSVLTGDPTDEDVLRDARIDVAAGIVVATRDDARDVLSILAARKANPDIRIVAAANEPRHAEKLEQVGADAVVSPTVIGGRILGRSVLEESSPDSLLDDDPMGDDRNDAELS